MATTASHCRFDARRLLKGRWFVSGPAPIIRTLDRPPILMGRIAHRDSWFRLRLLEPASVCDELARKHSSRISPGRCKLHEESHEPHGKLSGGSPDGSWPLRVARITF